MGKCSVAAGDFSGGWAVTYWPRVWGLHSTKSAVLRAVSPQTSWSSDPDPEGIQKVEPPVLDSNTPRRLWNTKVDLLVGSAQGSGDVPRVPKSTVPPRLMSVAETESVSTRLLARGVSHKSIGHILDPPTSLNWNPTILI